MLGMGRKKQTDLEVPKPSTRVALPKVFTDQYGSAESEVEEITNAVEDKVEDEIEVVQNKINELKSKQLPVIRKEKWELIKKIISQEITFLRNNQTGEEFQLENGSS